MEAEGQEIESEMSDRKDRGELSRRAPPGNDAHRGGVSWRVAELGLEAGLVPFFPQLVCVCASFLECQHIGGVPFCCFRTHFQNLVPQLVGVYAGLLELVVPFL